MRKSKKTILGSILALVVLVSAGAFAAQSNLFSSNELQSETLSYIDKADNHNAALKCGEGKCGDGDSKDAESKSDESKCGDGKCGDGKDAEKSSNSGEEKSEDAKCGEGKCGEGK